MHCRPVSNPLIYDALVHTYMILQVYGSKVESIAFKPNALGLRSALTALARIKKFGAEDVKEFTYSVEQLLELIADVQDELRKGESYF